MIINIKNKKDLITLDLRIKQIRYLRNYLINKDVLFDSLDLSFDDVLGYEYLFNKNKRLFLNVIKEELINNGIGLKINLKDLKIMKGGLK